MAPARRPHDRASQPRRAPRRATGDHVFSFEFTPTGKPDVAQGKGAPGTIKLFVDGKQVGAGDLPVTIPLTLGLSAGVCVGADSGSPVMLEDKEAAIQAYLKVAMARQ